MSVREATITPTVPLTITQEAADFIAEEGLQAVLQKFLDNIPNHIPNLHAISVFLQPPYDTGGGPCVILDVKRDIPPIAYDPTEWNWRRWVAENIPPEEFEHFCLLSNFGH
jgi:hypothetical protein